MYIAFSNLNEFKSNSNPNDLDFDLAIGYVPRAENEKIAKMMDISKTDEFSAQLTDIHYNEPYENRLRMTIFKGIILQPRYDDCAIRYFLLNSKI